MSVPCTACHDRLRLSSYHAISMNEHPTRERTSSSWDRRHYWHAFTQMAEYEPLVIERAEGCRLIDIDGREYLDGASSMWCNVHGHRHPRIDAAIREQLDRVAHCTSLGMGCDTTVRLAKRLADLAPGNLEHVFFSSDGSSAVEVALKMAFQYWRQCRQSAAGENEVHRARRSVSRRHDRQRERRRHRPVSCASSSRCCST